MPKPKPDDRSDNVEKLKEMTQDTKQNIEAANGTLQNEDLSEEQEKVIREKNERREESMEGMKAEMKDEARDRRKM